MQLSRISLRTLFVLFAALGSAAASACDGEGAAPCVPGEAGCSCNAGNTCNDGLACDPSANLCEGTRSVDLPAIDASARSCELLLEDDGADVVRAAFEDSVRGETVRQAPRTAVTFYSQADAPIARSAVRIELAGTGGMTIARARCFDREGRPIAGGGIAIGG